MSNVLEAFGTASQAITITLASLASGSAKESDAVDNTTNLFHDAELELQIKFQAGSPSGQKRVNVYIAVSQDGTDFMDNATGSDASITLRAPTNLFGPFPIQVPDSGGLTYKAVIPSVVAIIGGTHLPPKWSIIIENQTGVTFSATEGDHVKAYRGQYATA